MTEEIAAETLATRQSEASIKRTAGQRRINMVWEATQATIALSVVAAVIYCALMQIESNSLVNMSYLIVGFYFGRTNHQRVGGIGGETAGTR